jgi:uncharacterized RDD family membrane protein YckC
MSQGETHLARRAGAAFVDYFLFGALTSGFFAVQPWAKADSTGNYGAPGCLLMIPIALVWCFYFGYVEARFGRTLGKGLFDLLVERLDGKRLVAIDSLKRHILDPIELNFFGIPAIVAVKVTPQHQRLGDMLAGTRVILKRYEPK